MSAVEKEKLALELAKLARSNKKLYLETAMNSRVSKKEIGQLHTKISDISQRFQTLKERFDPVSANRQRFAEILALNTGLMVDAEKVSELADTPQLMDTCLRNQMYSEVLDLRAKLRHIFLHYQYIFQAKYRDPAEAERAISLLERIVKESDTVAESFRKSILQQLKNTADVITSLKLVSNLRRLYKQSNEFQKKDISAEEIERRLREEFLEAKRQVVASEGQPARELTHEELSELIEKNRKVWTSTISQYHTIFSLESVQDDEAKKGQLGETDSNQLSTWIRTLVTDFLRVLDAAVSQIEDVSVIVSLAEQCLVLSQDMTKYGAGFHGTVEHMFIAHLHTLFTSHWDDVFSSAVHSIEAGNWGMSAGRISNEGEASNGANSGTNEVLDPPVELLSFPVVAELVNGILVGFNELRYVNTPTMGSLLTNELEAVYLPRLCAALVNYRQIRGKDVLEQTKTRFEELCVLLRTIMLPYLESSIAFVFQGTVTLQIAEICKHLSTIVDEGA